MLKDIHVKWLTQRGLSAETVDRFELSSENNLLRLPYHDLQGNVTHAKLRTSDVRKFMRIEPKGAPKEFFNADALNDPDTPLVITEGEMDCMVAAQSGLRAVSVPNGAPAKEQEGEIVPKHDTAFDFIWDNDGDLRQELAQTKKFILCGDADEPGQILNIELAVRLGKHKCYAVHYPEGCKDLNDVLLSFGEDKVREIVEDARPMVSDTVTRMGERHIGPVQEGLASGWEALDPHLKLAFPELVTVSGIPGSGKSQFALAWACNLARLHRVKTCILQLEDRPERVYRDILSYAQSWGIRNPKDWVAEHFCEMKREEDIYKEQDLTLEWLKSAIFQSVMRFGCKMVILDPWNEIEHMWDKGQSETQYTNDALRELKKVGRMFNVAIVIVAHPSMGVKNKTADTMSMYDVAGSAAWYNKSDHGIIVSRVGKSTRVSVEKCKDQMTMGVPGAVEMDFNVLKRIFANARKAQ